MSESWVASSVSLDVYERLTLVSECIYTDRGSRGETEETEKGGSRSLAVPLIGYVASGKRNCRAWTQHGEARFKLFSEVKGAWFDST